MADVVEGNLADGSPRMVRTAQVPIFSGGGSTIGFRAKITSYENWTSLMTLFAGGFSMAFESDSDGSFYIYGRSTDDSLWEDDYAGWFDLYATFGESAGTFVVLDVYVRRVPEESEFDHVVDHSTNLTFEPTSYAWFAHPSFTSDMEGTVRFAKMIAWERILTLEEIETEADSREPVDTDDLIHFNDCTSAAAIGTDDDASAANFTVTGTPTDVDDDDPWAEEGGSVLDASASGTIGGINGTAVMSGTASAVASGNIGGLDGTAIGRGLASAVAAGTIGGLDGTAVVIATANASASGTIGGVNGTAAMNGTARASAAGTVGGVDGVAVMSGVASASAAGVIGGLNGTANLYTGEEEDPVADTTIVIVDIAKEADVTDVDTTYVEVDATPLAAVSTDTAVELVTARDD